MNTPCRLVVVPDMLKNAPMFKRIDPKAKVRCSLAGTPQMSMRWGQLTRFCMLPSPVAQWLLCLCPNSEPGHTVLILKFNTNALCCGIRARQVAWVLVAGEGRWLHVPRPRQAADPAVGGDLDIILDTALKNFAESGVLVLAGRL